MEKLKPAKMNDILKLLKGSIDMHCHHGPDPFEERSVDALQVIRQAQAAGMRAIVLKSQLYDTSPLAYIINQIVPDNVCVGGICMDRTIGGLNPYALEAAAQMGAKVVWMPTSTYANASGVIKNPDYSGTGVAFSDDKGKLLPAVSDILDIVKKYQMVLATGHISVSDTIVLVDEARKKGITKIVATHPTFAHSLEELRSLAKQGVFIEYLAVTLMDIDRLRKVEAREIIESIKAVGAEHSIFCTDLGMAFNAVPVEGMRVGICTMLRYGLTEKEIELMIKVNPAELLGLN